MSKSIRIALLVIAALCIPPIIFPELSGGASSADPAALLFITGAIAIFWPSPKKRKNDEED